MKKFNSLANWVFFEKSIEGYDMYLNPHPISIISQVKGKPVRFKIKSNNIICIKSDGRHKYIYLKEPVKSIKGELLNTNKIIINNAQKTLQTLCSDLDSLQFRLIAISRSDAVNVGFYDLNKNKLQLNLEKYASIKDCGIIKVGKGFIEKFIEKKEGYESIISLQKKMIHYKQ